VGFKKNHEKKTGITRSHPDGGVIMKKKKKNTEEKKGYY